jgi:hypothetical protein
MSTKLTDYIKIESMKQLILVHLENMGLKEQVRVMSDDEVNTIITMMWHLSVELQEFKDDAKKIEVLVSYIVSLWTKLLVNYGAKPEEL